MDVHHKEAILVAGSSHASEHRYFHKYFNFHLKKNEKAKSTKLSKAYVKYFTRGGRQLSNDILEDIKTRIMQLISRFTHVILLVILGTNDIRRQNDDRYFENLLDLTTWAKSKPNVLIFLPRLLPSPENDQQNKASFVQMDQMVRETFAVWPRVYSFSPIKGMIASGSPIQERYLKDQIHLKRQSVDHYAQAIVEFLANRPSPRLNQYPPKNVKQPDKLKRKNERKRINKRLKSAKN